MRGSRLLVVAACLGVLAVGAVPAASATPVAGFAGVGVSWLSARPDGSAAANPSGYSSSGDSFPPPTIAISADARYAAFDSTAPDLAASTVAPNPSIYLRDRSTGLTTWLVQGQEPSISADGKRVAYAFHEHAYVFDVDARTSRQLDVAPDGQPPDGPAAFAPVISADGNWVTFSSYATNLTPGDTNNSSDVFEADLAAGSLSRIGAGNANSFESDLSGDGRFVAFQSYASNFGGPRNALQSYVFDRATGGVETIGLAPDGTALGYDAYSPSISADGRFVAFSYDGPGQGVALRDRLTHTTRLLAPTIAFIHRAVISDDGSTIAAIGTESLTTPDFGVFAIDVTSGAVNRVDGPGVTLDSEAIANLGINADGTTIGFATTAVLDGRDVNQTFDVYLAQLPAAGTNLLNDGSFETPLATVLPETFRTGDQLGAWTVFPSGGQAVELEGNNLQPGIGPRRGNQFVRLQALDSGVCQTLTVPTGLSLQGSFAATGAPHDGSLDVSWNGAVVKSFPLNDGLGTWVRRSFTVETGTANSGTLCFVSISKYGNFLDAVVLG